ncbi:MAG: GTP 3',8-cyclase MoaA [Eubacteriaceae bacterium]|nr:GTP 3',8-cyclase MoaA [Eubacteriaceae bacterium]
MLDKYGRNINYLRVSITDRCNLRCKYCMPDELPFIPHGDILRYEEILQICKAAAALGINAIKVTGGEPLARKGCVDFIKDLKALPGIQAVTLTTNGVLLEPYIEELAQAGLDGINISLDTLNPENYKKITGRDEFAKVWSALQQTIKSPLYAKLNFVPIKGINDKEIVPFARLAEELPIHIRFIELMPTSLAGGFSGVPSEEALFAIKSEFKDLAPEGKKLGNGPARYYKSERLLGSIGFIDAISNHFCSECNRLRLTSEGFLKLCLYHNDGIDLRSMLRSGASEDGIRRAIEDAVLRKPEKHDFGNEKSADEGLRRMSRIGG